VGVQVCATYQCWSGGLRAKSVTTCPVYTTVCVRKLLYCAMMSVGGGGHGCLTGCHVQKPVERHSHTRSHTLINSHMLCHLIRSQVDLQRMALSSPCRHCSNKRTLCCSKSAQTIEQLRRPNGNTHLAVPVHLQYSAKRAAAAGAAVLRHAQTRWHALQVHRLPPKKHNGLFCYRAL